MKRTMTVLAMLLTGVAAQAQPRRPKADVTPIVDASLRAGTTVRVALRVNLPAGFHVQAHTPRDPSLIPTVLTVTPPSGISVADIVYPKPTDLKQDAQEQSLAVFEETFVIGVRLAIDPAMQSGDIAVRGRLRYQACDVSSCYAPTSEPVQWTLHVVPAEPN